MEFIRPALERLYRGIIVITTVMFTLVLMCSIPADAGEKIQGKKEPDIPLHKGMWFIDYITLKNSVAAARYCSSAPAASVLKFYKNIFKNAVEIQEGSSKGKVYKLLLDVASPMKWRDSKRFIEIYTDKGRPDCRAVVHIAEKPKATKDRTRLPAKTKQGPIPAVSPESVSPAKTGYYRERKFAGAGVFSNAVNFSAGPTLILWPLENLAIQAYYGVGTFTSYEIRGFYRFDISSALNPYMGAGYVHAEKEANVIGVDTDIQGDSFTIFGGIELPVYKGLFAYIEIGGTPMKLEKDVVNGTRRAKAKVDYSSTTMGAGLIFYFW